jgi:hypothetical protein
LARKNVIGGLGAKDSLSLFTDYPFLYFYKFDGEAAPILHGPQASLAISTQATIAGSRQYKIKIKVQRQHYLRVT